MARDRVCPSIVFQLDHGGENWVTISLVSFDEDGEFEEENGSVDVGLVAPRYYREVEMDSESEAIALPFDIPDHSTLRGWLKACSLWQLSTTWTLSTSNDPLFAYADRQSGVPYRGRNLAKAFILRTSGQRDRIGKLEMASLFQFAPLRWRQNLMSGFWCQ